MGIRFTCPNGHKLNVKAFLAGRTGFCPFCGVKVEIPTESTRWATKKSAGGGAAKDAKLQPAPKTPAPVTPALSRPSARPQVEASVLNTIGAGPAPGTVRPVSASAAPAAPAAVPFEPVTPAASAPLNVAQTVEYDFSAKMEALAASAPYRSAVHAVPDPLMESPDAVWYVRPPGGGQFGPAAAAVMRAWLLEGRISGDSLVWREGWRDWQEAGAVFPQLQADGLAGAATPAAMHDTARLVHRKSPAKQAAIITALIIAVIVLIVVFVWVLTRQETTPPPPKSGAAKPAATTPGGSSDLRVAKREASPLDSLW